MMNNQLVRNDVTSLNFSNMDYFNIIFKLCKSKKEFYILKFTESHLEKYYSISAGKDLEKKNYTLVVLPTSYRETKVIGSIPVRRTRNSLRYCSIEF